EAFMLESAALPTNDANITSGDIPMPVWFFVSEMNENHQAVLEYWNDANKVGDAVLSDNMATGIYMAVPNSIDNLLNDQAFLAQTRFTVAEDPEANDQQRARAVWDFLSDIVRPVSYANQTLRPDRTAEEWGMVKRTIEIDGVNRYWLEFVPEQLAQTEDGKAPLLVVLHGGNQLPEPFMADTDVIKLANSRGLIAIVPAGSPNPRDNRMPAPTWNIMEDEGMLDDYAFIRAAVEDTINRLPIDTSRVYVTGLSMGSVGSQAFALRMGDIFAACATGSGMLMNTWSSLFDSEKVQDQYIMPVYVINGSQESGTGFEDESYQTIYANWLAFNGLEADTKAALTGYNRVGKYNIWTYANEKGIPLVQYGLGDGRVHALVLEDLYLLYDGFLSKYSRGEDGTLYYLGEAVAK
ncbi:MAG: PHB depolymerase family esterase, partial [Clostridia bacterium]|nr:PHB depolymerase family esterase [Clostridia bacterium]